MGTLHSVLMHILGNIRHIGRQLLLNPSGNMPLGYGTGMVGVPIVRCLIPVSRESPELCGVIAGINRATSEGINPRIT